MTKKENKKTKQKYTKDNYKTALLDSLNVLRGLQDSSAKNSAASFSFNIELANSIKDTVQQLHIILG